MGFAPQSVGSCGFLSALSRLMTGRVLRYDFFSLYRELQGDTSGKASLSCRLPGEARPSAEHPAALRLRAWLPCPQGWEKPSLGASVGTEQPAGCREPELWLWG